jgi:phage tail sheath protein FI
MPTYKTPDVYIEEISVFPPSVAEVETAIPAFVGYTEKATRTTAGDLLKKPTKIFSLKEFEALFGGAHTPNIAITVTPRDDGSYSAAVKLPELDFFLYHAMKMFFDNGGGQCYVVSIGTYADGFSDAEQLLTQGLETLELEDEPTLLVIPEMVRLPAAGYRNLAQAMLAQCGELKDRFAIFDIRDGHVDLAEKPPKGKDDYATINREHFGINNLKYGAAYYPFLQTSLNHAIAQSDTTTEDESNVLVVVKSGKAVKLGSLKTTNTGVYNFVKAELKNYFLVMPPSAAVAGIYAATDASRGVWKAPANVSLADVLGPVVRLDNVRQASLNVDATTGKSINAIRAQSGKGTIVWGARTLAGNDNEWRYIPVRRFYNMVEESIKKSTAWAVFEPNDANTWTKVRGMIENYLTLKWREGALAGATPQQAFFVRCALGVTMTAQDVLEGRMHVEIGMAVVRPAEFIILRFSHKLQTS